jgi:hypothetical protein
MQRSQSGFGVAGLIAILFVALVSGFTYIRVKQADKEIASTRQVDNFDQCVAAGNPIMESFPEQCTAKGQTFTKETEMDLYNSGWNTRLESGQGAFSVMFPDGWADIIKVLDSDWFLIGGNKQPEAVSGESVKVTELASYGGDSQSIFSILLHDNFAAPEGVPTEYTLVNGKENPISGKKYIHEYTADTEVGIGYLRIKGDRDYTYVFDVGNGKELRIYYSVYNSDPSNQIEIVDTIVDSILLN